MLNIAVTLTGDLAPLNQPFPPTQLRQALVIRYNNTKIHGDALCGCANYLIKKHSTTRILQIQFQYNSTLPGKALLRTQLMLFH